MSSPSPDVPAPKSASGASTLLDDMISQFSVDGNLSFDDDDTDALYAAVARHANNKDPLPETPEEIEEFLESIPLFATRMPEEGKESDAFKAIIALMNQTPKDKRMLTFKENGNKSYKLAVRMAEPRPNETEFEKEKRLTGRRQKLYDALNNYHAAIDMSKDVVDMDAEEFPKAVSIIHSNIAQCHLLLENFGHAFSECKKAIHLDNNNHKAYYRAATALNRVHKYQHAFMVLRKGMCLQLEKDSPERKAMVELAKKIITNWKREEDYQRAKAERKRAAEAVVQAEKAALDAVLAKRKINVGISQFSNTDAGYKGKLYVDEKKKLHFPVVLLYPDAHQSDFLQDVDEYVTFNDIFKMLFPPHAPAPAWDTRGEFVVGNLEVYVKVGESQSWAEDTLRVDADAGEKFAFNPSVAIGHALTSACKKGYVVPGFPTFCVRPIKK